MAASIHSYPKILNLGHKYLEKLFEEEVLVEEKVDGSQFSFRRVDENNVTYRTIGREIFPPVNDKLFHAAVEYIESIKSLLTIGYTYRGEVLHARQHNTLLYGRVPNNNVVIFDIDTHEERFLTYEEKKEEAARIGLETVPVLFQGKIGNIEELRDLLETRSFLSTEECQPVVEGIVVKNYARISIDGKTLMGKWVREAFKELNGASFKNANPSNTDFLEKIIETYKHENRWKKAVQHLRDNGELLGEPKDIGPLIGAAIEDTKQECEAEIRDALWKHAWPKIARGIIRGLPEWYKEELAKKQFEKETVNVEPR
jgi:ATP-dependent RNA circularization protein (DNA/RNA ligase family)